MDSTNTWPFGFNEEDTMIMANTTMVLKLLERKHISLTEEEERALIALGIVGREAREEGAGMGMRELAWKSGLSVSFIPMLEAGKAVPDEITPEVLTSLAAALSIEIQDLERAYFYM